ncbi:MAG: DUF5069 domain-containing protein [Candidatus Eremiobacteraeota bacterium]|nr:DUF5069 domain-containing protein [Candidatus Eremiobacteraeota bacterium]
MGRMPPRWNVEVDGIRWLPRMIEKARMRERGTLGAYLIGHSPVDAALLKRLNITTAAFVELVREQPDDIRVLVALRARRFDEAAVRRWSDTFPRRYALYITLWDLDEGYTLPKRWQRPLIACFHRVEGPVMQVFRRILRAP